MTTVDVNGDGKPDIIVPDYGMNNIAVLLNAGNGTFINQTSYSAGSGPYYVTTADVNGDNKPDVIVTGYYSNSVSVLLNRCTGTSTT